MLRVSLLLAASLLAGCCPARRQRSRRQARSRSISPRCSRPPSTPIRDRAQLQLLMRADRAAAAQHRRASGCRRSTVDGQAQYQSDVRTCGVPPARRQPLFSPPKATFDAGIRIEQRLFDATIERAGRARARAARRAAGARAHDALRAATAGERRVLRGGRAAGAARRARRHRRRSRGAAATRSTLACAQGTALPAEAAAIEATLLQRRQDEDELRANRAAALARLAILTGQRLGTATCCRCPIWRRRSRRRAQASADAARPSRVRAVRADPRASRAAAGR